VQAAAGQNSPSPTVPEAGPASESLPRTLRRLLAPLRRCLDRRSVVGRHALRFGVVTAVAVAIEEVLATPFGYWIPLTVTVVLKPYAGSTLTRAGPRLAGTIAGAAVGVAVTHMLSAPLARAAVAGAAFYATLAVLPLNYAFAIFFLSAGVVPFESFMGPSTSWPVGMLRVLHTCVGGALALAGGYVLWPSFERRSLPALLSATCASMALYADRVLAAPAGDPPSPALLDAAHRQAGVDNTNLQASFQRVVSEPGGEREQLAASYLAVVMLQRLLSGLNALTQLAPGAQGLTEWQQLREMARRALGDLPSALDSGSRPAVMPDIARECQVISRGLVARGDHHGQLLALEVERIGWRMIALRAAVERLAASGPSAPLAP
jgi:uncharacterized membrane protein YccC